MRSRAELDLRMDRAFLEFDFMPLASASIGQVHRAVLPDGQEVAVKVQRPAAGDQIEADLGLLYQAARLLRERVKALEFMDPQELVDEFARSIRLELDYGHEAKQRRGVPPQLREGRTGRRPTRHPAVLDAADPHARVSCAERRSPTSTSSRCGRTSDATSPTSSRTPG